MENVTESVYVTGSGGGGGGARMKEDEKCVSSALVVIVVRSLLRLTGGIHRGRMRVTGDTGNNMLRYEG